MLERLSRHWWLFALRGAAAILFAILAFLWPGLTLAVLVLLFGAYALVDGLFALAGAVRCAAERERWWPLLLEGIAGIAAGLLVFFWPAISALALLYVIAGWALVTGFFEIVAAVRLRRDIENEWLLGLSGAASVLLGILLIVAPGAGALAVVWLIALYALLYGLLQVALGFRLRRFAEGTRTRAAA